MEVWRHTEILRTFAWIASSLVTISLLKRRNYFASVRHTFSQQNSKRLVEMKAKNSVSLVLSSYCKVVVQIHADHGQIKVTFGSNQYLRPKTRFVFFFSFLSLTNFFFLEHNGNYFKLQLRIQWCISVSHKSLSYKTNVWRAWKVQVKNA